MGNPQSTNPPKKAVASRVTDETKAAESFVRNFRTPVDVDKLFEVDIDVPLNVQSLLDHLKGAVTEIVRRLEDNITSLDMVNVEQHSEMERLGVEASTLDAQLTKTLAERGELDDQCEQLKQQLLDQSALIDAQREKAHEGARENTELTEANLQLTGQVSVLTGENERLKEQWRARSSEAGELHEKLERSNHDRDFWKTRAEELGQTVDQQARDWDSDTKAHEKYRVNKEKEIEAIGRRSDEFRRTSEQRREELEELQRRSTAVIEALTIELRDAKDLLREQEPDLAPHQVAALLKAERDRLKGK